MGPKHVPRWLTDGVVQPPCAQTLPNEDVFTWMPSLGGEAELEVQHFPKKSRGWAWGEEGRLPGSHRASSAIPLSSPFIPPAVHAAVLCPFADGRTESQAPGSFPPHGVGVLRRTGVVSCSDDSKHPVLPVNGFLFRFSFKLSSLCQRKYQLGANLSLTPL